MSLSERVMLLGEGISNGNEGLSLLFSIVCIVDVFGVFPVVALPKPIIDCGLYGVLLVGIVCSVQVYTAALLGKCWLIAEDIEPTIIQKNRYPYSALAYLTYGKSLAKFVTFLMDMSIFGGGIPNLIVASQNLQLFWSRVNDNSFDFSFCYWIIITGVILCPILWMGSPKDMKLICSISVAIVIAVFLIICGCLLETAIPNKLNTPSPSKPFWQILFTAYGIISFQFDIHPTILTIQVDMKDKSNLGRAVLGGFAVSLGMFATTTVITAAKFGHAVHPSILETLPTTIPLHFAAVLVAVQLSLTSAVSNNALYQHVEDSMGISRVFNHRRCILRTILTLCAILIAESVPRFDLVMSLIGGTLIAPLVFIMPPLFYVRMLVLKEKHDQELANETFANIVYNTEHKPKFLAKYVEGQFRRDFSSNSSLNEKDWWKKVEIFFCFFIIISSIAGTLVSTYVNVHYAFENGNFSKPCIYNISTDLINF